MLSIFYDVVDNVELFLGDVEMKVFSGVSTWVASDHPHFTHCTLIFADEAFAYNGTTTPW